MSHQDPLSVDPYIYTRVMHSRLGINTCLALCANTFVLINQKLQQIFLFLVICILLSLSFILLIPLYFLVRNSEYYVRLWLTKGNTNLVVF